MFRQYRQLLIFQLGVVMLAIVALAVMSASTSLFIGEAIEGKTEGVNIAGALRMESYRLASVLLNDESVDRMQSDRDVALLIDAFQLHLADPVLRLALPGDTADPLRLSYRRVQTRWEREIRPLLVGYLGGADLPGDRRKGIPGEDARSRYLRLLPGFVEDIDRFVARLVHDTERRVARLRRYQFVLLVATLLVTGLALMITYRKVHQPLKVLMRMARRAGQGDFSVRTPFQGDDELGRLGQAFNLLARDLSGLYRELESIVAEKTAHLEHSRRSLELLYKTSRAVSKPVIDESVFATLLSDIEELAETGPGVICLANGFRQGGGTSSLVCRHHWEGDRVCTAGQCDAELAREAASSHRIAIPITDQSRQHGVLLMQLPETGRLEDWQQPLLEAVATNIGIALTRAEQVTEQRRLALLEERGVIARELHDSLAQALSYLKIQVTRLQNAIDNGIDGEALQSIVQELREGVGGAYRELRELLTTFRLRMDEQGLDQALRSAVDEFSRRGSVAIDLDYRISRTIFTPHEEIHLLHVVREALWNVTHHSGAQHCSVMLGQRDDGCVVLVIDDDGGGFDGIGAKGSRYGLTIMKERACSLGGSIRFGTAESGGARIEVAFTPERDKTAHNTMEKTLG